MSFPRRHLTLVVLLTTGALDRLAAQVHWSSHLGATYTTTMVTDQIAGNVVTVAPGISPTLGIAATYPLKSRVPLHASAELQLALGTLERTERGVTADVSPLRTVAFTGGLEGQIRPEIGWRLGIGLVSYGLSEKSGVFQEGRPIRLLGTAALEYSRALTSSLRLRALLRYDIHAFTTKQLQSNGYTGSQTVHRATVGVGVSR